MTFLGCESSFENPCPEGDCDSLSSSSTQKDLEIGSAASGTQGTGRQDGGASFVNPIGISRSESGNSSNGSGSGEDSSESTSSNGFGTTNGANTSGGGTSSGAGSSVEPTSNNFMVIDQLADKVVETEDYFVIQYIVTGEPPLTYQWYKKSASGADQKIGENKAFFYELDVNFGHAGIYYAIVTDGKGRTIKSREAKVHVIAGRKPCDSQKYAPRYRMDRSGQLDWNYLYEKPYLANREQWAIQTVRSTSDSGFYIKSCENRVAATGYCFGAWNGHIKYQCQNGKFKLVQNTCFCSEDYSGGGN